MRSSAIMTARTSRRNSDRIRALLPAAAAIIIWCYGYLPLLISRLRRNRAGSGNRPAPFRRGRPLSTAIRNCTAERQGNRRFVSEAPVFCLFLPFSAGGGILTTKRTARDSCSALRAKSGGVQPQSATSRLPIQRKGEREIAESCYVRMIPRGLVSSIAASGRPELRRSEIY